MRFLNSFKEAFLRLLITGSVFVAIIAIGFFTGDMMENELGTIAFCLIPYIAVPVLTVNAFSFLFKRKASDTFFSLPIKRSVLFLSSICAVVLWLLIMYLPAFFRGGSYYEGYANYLYHFVSCIYTMGVFALGTALTGRLFSAIVNSGIIAFVPVALYSAVISILKSRLLDILVWSSPDMPYTKVIGFEYIFLAFLGEYVIFYLVLGLIYLALAFILFLLRKSETAEKSAPNKILRIIYGALSGFSVALLGLSLLLEVNPSGSTIIIIYGIAILTPLLYEFISVKKLKYGFISLGIGALAYVLVLASCSVTEFIVRNQEIEAVGYKLMDKYQTVEGERKGDTYVWGDWLDGGYNSYSQIMTDPYFVTDTEKLELVMERYNENASKKINYSVGYKTMIQLLDKNGKRYYRYAYFSVDEQTALSKTAIYEDEEFISLTASLPAPETVEKLRVDESLYSADVDTRLYETFFREMLLLSDEERISCTLNVDNLCPIEVKEHDGYIERVLTVSGRAGNEGEYFASYKIVPEYHPETYKYIRDRVQKESVAMAVELLTVSRVTEQNTTVTLICYPDEEDYPKLRKIDLESISVELSNPYNIEIYNYNNKSGHDSGRLPGYVKRFAGSTILPEKFCGEIKELIKNNQTDSLEPTGIIKINYRGGYIEREALIAIDLEYEDFMEISKMFDEVMNK